MPAGKAALTRCLTVSGVEAEPTENRKNNTTVEIQRTGHATEKIGAEPSEGLLFEGTTKSRLGLFDLYAEIHSRHRWNGTDWPSHRHFPVGAEPTRQSVDTSPQKQRQPPAEICDVESGHHGNPSRCADEC